MRKFITFCMAGSLLMSAAPSSAALISRTFTFSATNFGYAVAGVTPPFETVSGSFSIRYDDTLNYNSESAGITLHSLSLPIGPPSLVFSYSNAGPPFLRISGAQNGEGLVLGTTDLGLAIFNSGGASPMIGPFFYTAPGYFDSVFVSSNTRLTFVEATAVPEPASWAMMIIGFGMAGGLLRRRRSPRVSYVV